MNARTFSSMNSLLRSLLLGALLTCATAWATGAQTGRIDGHVVDKSSKNALPQVTVEISSPALIGGAQSHMTADDGSFSFRQLPPGMYTAKISMEGLKPMKKQVVVQIGTTTPLEVEWSPEVDTLSETVEIVGQNQMNADSTQSGAVMNASDQAKIASSRRYQDVTNQAAGVSSGADQGNPNVMGGSSLMNRYLIDGLDVTDPVSNTFSTNINFDSIDSIQVLTGGMEAQYNSMGGVINLITKGGSDEFHVDTSIYYNNQNLSASNNYGSGLAQGFRPFDTTPNSPNSGLQANLSLSGPLIPTKLWFSGGVQYWTRASSQAPGPPLYQQSPAMQRLDIYPRLKLTFAPVTEQRFTVSLFGDPAHLDYIGNDQGGGNYSTPLASSRQNQGSISAVVSWDDFITTSLTTHLQVGYQNSNLSNGPQGILGSISPSDVAGFPSWQQKYNANTPAQINNDDGSQWFNATSNYSDVRTSWNLEGSIMGEASGATGKHSWQTGVQARIANDSYSQSTPGNAYYIDQGGGPSNPSPPNGFSPNFLCNQSGAGISPGTSVGGTAGCYQLITSPAFKASEQGWTVGVYVQDRWKPTTWLTILPGLRFDYGTTTNTDQALVSSLNGIGPRLGGVWDITHDNKTLFTAFYGRSNEVMSLMAANFANPQPLSTIYQYNGSTFQQVATSGGPGSVVLNPAGLTTPHSDMIQVGIRRLLGGTMTGGIQYTWKRLSNIWEAIEQNMIFDPSGTRIMGFKGASTGPVNLVTTPDQNWNVYQGADFTLQGDPSPNFHVYAAYTLAFKYGPGADELGQLGLASQFYNPRQYQFYDGYSFGDVRHQIKFSGSYTVGGFSIGPNIQWQSGQVRAALFQTGNTTLTNKIMRSPIGTAPNPGTPNSMAAITEFRTPPILEVDARASYDFPKFSGLQTTLMLDVFNVLNLGGSQDVVSSAWLPNYQQSLNHQAPLRAQLSIRVQY
jgi:hypothetical protein